MAAVDAWVWSYPAWQSSQSTPPSAPPALPVAGIDQVPYEPTLCVGLGWGELGSRLLLLWEWVPMLLVAPYGSGELVGAALGVWMDFCFSETATFGGWWESDPPFFSCERKVTVTGGYAFSVGLAGHEGPCLWHLGVPVCVCAPQADAATWSPCVRVCVHVCPRVRLYMCVCMCAYVCACMFICVCMLDLATGEQGMGSQMAHFSSYGFSFPDEDGPLCRALQPAVEHQCCPHLVQSEPGSHPHV